MIDVLDSIFVKKYFTLSGRASRREYWLGQFTFWIIHALAASLSLVIFKSFYAMPNPDDAAALGIKFVTACFIFSLPTYIWRHVGVLFLLAVAGFVGLAIMPVADLWAGLNNSITTVSRFIAPVVVPAIPVLLATLYLLPPCIAVTVRRFHDRSMPGVTLFFIPEFVGFIIDLLAGSKKDNRYGPPSNI